MRSSRVVAWRLSSHSCLGFRRQRLGVPLHGMIKGGAGFASQDKPPQSVEYHCACLLPSLLYIQISSMSTDVVFWWCCCCWWLRSAWLSGFVLGLPYSSVLDLRSASRLPSWVPLSVSCCTFNVQTPSYLKTRRVSPSELGRWSIYSGIHVNTRWLITWNKEPS